MSSLRPRAEDVGATLAEMIDEAAEWLPQQAPLSAFVHHNSLHHLEHLSFEQAVAEGARVLGTESYLSEASFAEHLRSGRIQARDLHAVLDARTPDPATLLFDDGPTRRTFRGFRLRHLFEIPSGASLRWWLSEGKAATQPHPDVPIERRRTIAGSGFGSAALADLWSRLERAAPMREEPSPGSRPRDWLLAQTRIDTDDRVHPLLIRLSAAFLDQGVAYWSMPNREHGLLSAVRSLYGRRAGPRLRWTRGLSETLAAHQRAGWDAEATIVWALDEMGIPAEERAEVIRATLLSLRGWAGMMRQLELRPDRAPVQSPPCSLAEYLALQLTFDVFAARACLRECGSGDDAPLSTARRRQPAAKERDMALVYEAYVLAQLSDIDLRRFDEPGVVGGWVRAVSEFDEVERRCVLHLAYERRHRVEVLDGLAAIAHAGSSVRPGRSEVCFQAVFCIDDREESLRRHLEEIEPCVETWGYAGFFGVAMDYQGLDDVRPRPLCPVVVDPEHFVAEVPTSPPAHEGYRLTRRLRGSVSHAAVVGTRTLVRGALATSLLGPLSTIPLVGRALFPHLAHEVSHWLSQLGIERPATRLAIEFDDAELPGAKPRPGYTVDEMAGIVGSALRTMGLDPSSSPLALIVGHGSSSLNNPHEAAHDCGATGGGRGGPNARAFAAMANHADVRRELLARGLRIPDETWFVGAYHNTCDDAVVYYDEDLVPASHREVLASARRAMAEACARDAHERCRRFESAPLGIGIRRAVKEAQEHSVDLAQPRPEYGHATNAVCVVGRRVRTRGLFLDRRAFLVSYDPTSDPSGERLAPLLLSVGPVGAGINLEYYFSYVDPTGYGCGTKLPHNIVGLLGVMDGHASDLRTGLPWQMVEIHEPVRLLTVVDARRAVLEKVLAQRSELARLVGNGWIQFVCWEPDGALFVFEEGGFRRYRPEAGDRPVFPSSIEYYRGHRQHLPPARIGSGAAA